MPMRAALEPRLRALRGIRGSTTGWLQVLAVSNIVTRYEEVLRGLPKDVFQNCDHRQPR